ncbi:MAG: S-layer homology domain-containing protein, partial [Candidatus Eremiobacterota bacterium]
MRNAVTMLLFLSLSAGSVGAPLFPDVPENHWARDAVAALAAKGLVEGYPDGTFKGDRAASRWEVAMVVARLLAKLEQEHATFATRAELEELRKLTAALREELDALGVRVANLEESTARLDKRVTELERITFYGSVTTRVGSQNFFNTGSAQSDPVAPAVNYQNAVGGVQGAG